MNSIVAPLSCDGDLVIALDTCEVEPINGAYTQALELSSGIPPRAIIITVVPLKLPV